MLEFVRPYIPELVGWFRDFGVGAANYDANGHYARIQPIFNAFQFAEHAGRPGRSSSRSRSRSASRACRPACCAAARARPASSRRTARRPYLDSGGNLDCDPTQVRGGSP